MARVKVGVGWCLGAGNSLRVGTGVGLLEVFWDTAVEGGLEEMVGKEMDAPQQKDGWVSAVSQLVCCLVGTWRLAGVWTAFAETVAPWVVEILTAPPVVVVVDYILLFHGCLFLFRLQTV